MIQSERACWVCGSTKWLESHHIFGASNRKSSEIYGLVVWLCPEHHRGNNGVHSGGELMEMLHKVGQKEFEKMHSREDFMKVFGRNYLD